MRMNAADSDYGEPELELPGYQDVSVNFDEVQDVDYMEVDTDLWEDHDVPVGIDPPAHTANEENQCPRRATVEDGLDEPAAVDDTYIEAYLRPAGTTRGQGESAFAAYRRGQVEDGQSPWSPFESVEEWNGNSRNG